MTEWDRSKIIPWDSSQPLSVPRSWLCLQRCWEGGSLGGVGGWQAWQSLGWGGPLGDLCCSPCFGIRNLPEQQLPPVTSHKIINPRYTFYTFRYKTLNFLPLLLCLMPNEVISAAPSWFKKLSVLPCWSLLGFGLFNVSWLLQVFQCRCCLNRQDNEGKRLQLLAQLWLRSLS